MKATVWFWSAPGSVHKEAVGGWEGVGRTPLSSSWRKYSSHYDQVGRDMPIAHSSKNQWKIGFFVFHFIVIYVLLVGLISQDPHL